MLVPSFTKFRVRFAADSVFSSGPIPQPTIASRIDKDRSIEAFQTTGGRFPGFHAFDASIALGQSTCDVSREKLDARCGHGGFTFLLVLASQRAAVGIVFRIDLFQDPSGTAVDSQRVNTNFFRGVAAKNGPVLDQCHFQSLRTCRQRRTTT
ncbi:hypothetical protein-signal peptide prediction [Rhodopirellula baltica SH 1]|uniref:Uncharacterized protein n=1 Tax=Rhodopirellula baltica (strain DSM 10527 / NCIMB 13988 / SH1) TaxID=243090 RepID=Q7UGQ1_RHOBA|nr:hypothetical protein-signal peptide prediction [Rhodopirellula baltica SH 1]